MRNTVLIINRRWTLVHRACKQFLLYMWQYMCYSGSSPKKFIKVVKGTERDCIVATVQTHHGATLRETLCCDQPTQTRYFNSQKHRFQSNCHESLCKYIVVFSLTAILYPANPDRMQTPAMSYHLRYTIFAFRCCWNFYNFNYYMTVI